MKRLNFITKNLEGKYNQFSVDMNESGQLNIYDEDFADKICEGNCDILDTSDYISLDLIDGANYAEVYVNGISENNQYFSELENYIGNVGSYLDEITYYQASKEEEKDRGDFIENIIKRSSSF